MVIRDIDKGRAFDWGRTSEDYAKYRDIYPQEFYDCILDLGLCKDGQKVLDIGTGIGAQHLLRQIGGQRFRRGQGEKGLGFRPAGAQEFQHLHGEGQVLILGVIRTNKYSLHFRALCASSTTVCGSGGFSAGRRLRRHRYSIFPSGPRMGDQLKSAG